MFLNNINSTRLQNNYEYCEGSNVRSQEVLEQYNKVHYNKVRFLSHIGRMIKIVFPDAKHIRRQVKDANNR